MKILKIVVVLAAIMVAMLTACSPRLAEEGTTSEVPVISPEVLPTTELTQQPGYEPVPEESLKNGTYVIDGQPVHLVDGTAETEAAPGSASMQVTRYFGYTVNIDLNADGLMDAAFLLQQETGGSGEFYYVAAALQNEGGILGTNAIFLGDRISPQSITADLHDPAHFIVNYTDRKPAEPMSAQPSVDFSRVFKFENGSLVEVLPVP